MADFGNTTDEELKARLDTILARLDYNLKYVAPMMLKIARDREEAGDLISEMRKRGLQLEPGKDAPPSTV
jgi:hypothetical protein